MLIRNEEYVIVKNLVLNGGLKEQFGEVVELYIERDGRNKYIMETLEKEHGRNFLDTTFEEYMDDSKTLEDFNRIRFVDLEEFVYSLQNEVPYGSIEHINSLHAIMHSSK